MDRYQKRRAQEIARVPDWAKPLPTRLRNALWRACQAGDIADRHCGLARVGEFNLNSPILGEFSNPCNKIAQRELEG